MKGGLYVSSVCIKCGGHGWIYHIEYKNGEKTEDNITCPICNGDGEV